MYKRLGTDMRGGVMKSCGEVIIIIECLIARIINLINLIITARLTEAII